VNKLERHGKKEVFVAQPEVISEQLSRGIEENYKQHQLG
jgi:hypothetical protein